MFSVSSQWCKEKNDFCGWMFSSKTLLRRDEGSLPNQKCINCCSQHLANKIWKHFLLYDIIFIWSDLLNTMDDRQCRSSASQQISSTNTRQKSSQFPLKLNKLLRCFTSDVSNWAQINSKHQMMCMSVCLKTRHLEKQLRSLCMMWFESFTVIYVCSGKAVHSHHVCLLSCERATNEQEKWKTIISSDLTCNLHFKSKREKKLTEVSVLSAAAPHRSLNNPSEWSTELFCSDLWSSRWMFKIYTRAASDITEL